MKIEEIQPGAVVRDNQKKRILVLTEVHVPTKLVDFMGDPEYVTHSIKHFVAPRFEYLGRMPHGMAEIQLGSCVDLIGAGSYLEDCPMPGYDE